MCETLNYKEFEYGIESNKITITLLDGLMGLNLVGMISSSLFKETVAIVIADKSEDEDLSFACLGCGKDGVAPRVMMTDELLTEFKKNVPVAQVVLMHELGHYYNSDIGNNDDNSDDRRRNLVAQNKVCPKEIKADAFAIKYLGKDTVIAGLETLKQRMLDVYKDYDEESVELSVKEIDIRISSIKQSII